MEFCYLFGKNLGVLRLKFKKLKFKFEEKCFEFRIKNLFVSVKRRLCLPRIYLWKVDIDF